MAKLHIAHEARTDLQGIKEYISVELVNPTAAENVIFKIMKAMRSLVDFPDKGAPLSTKIKIPNNYRYLVCGSYLVFYRCEGDNVYVIRILYGRRECIKILFGESQDSDGEPSE